MIRDPEEPLPDPHKAGRTRIRSPRPVGEETVEDARDQWRAEYKRLRLDPTTVPPGSETAQETFARFVRDHLAPSLRSLGFKGSGSRYKLDHGEHRGYLTLLKSRHNTTRAVVEFTVELWVADAATGQAYWSARLPHVMPEHAHFWWRLPAGADVGELLTDVVSSIRDYGLAAMRRAFDHPDNPPDHLGQLAGAST